MAHLRCDFRSDVMDMGTSMTVILPESIPSSQAKVVYLLHGLADNCTGWVRYTSVERYARLYNLALVIPEVQRSYYTDMKSGLKYFSFISEELRQKCINMFGFSTARENNYIMGLSMGGYGSLKCALTNPGRYEGCAAFSTVTDIIRASRDKTRDNENQGIFGCDLQVDNSSRLDYLLSQATDLPSFYLATGEEDGFFNEALSFSELLKEKGCDVSFEHWTGIHNWDFWDVAVKKAFDHFFGNK